MVLITCNITSLLQFKKNNFTNKLTRVNKYSIYRTFAAN